MAPASSPPRPPGRTNIAAREVGTLAHGYLEGTPPSVDTIPGRLAFDALTPTIGHSHTQARAIATCARELLTAQGWGVISREKRNCVRRDELTGHLDIRAWHSVHGEAVIDLKTGAQIGAAWIQVGGYLTLYAQIGTGLYTQLHTGMIQGGVLHVPRVAMSKDVKGTLELRDGKALADAWAIYEDRIDTCCPAGSPTRSPGIHCGRCHVADCAVRIKDVKP